MRALKSLLHLALLTVVFLSFRVAASAQQLTEEAYMQMVLDAFDKKENCLSTVLPSLATNFNFEVVFEQTPLAAFETSSKISIGASSKDSYILVADSEGRPYCFMNTELFVILGEDSQDAFMMLRGGKHRFRFSLLGDQELEFLIGYDTEDALSRNEVTFNLSAAFVSAIKGEKITVFDKTSHTMEFKLEKERVFAIQFPKQPGSSPIGVESIKLKSPKALIKFGQFRFQDPANERVAKLNLKSLQDAGIPVKQITADELNVPLYFPKNYKWSDAGRTNSVKLKKLLGLAD